MNNILEIPKNSLLEPWCDSLNITEIPRSYQIFAALSMVGGLIGRKMYVDQMKFRIYPNISVMFIGPSGIGKDTIINQMTRAIREVYGGNTLRLIEGKTIEYVHQQLLGLSSPAQAWILAPELTAFLGGKDYQKSLVQDITNLLSTNEILDVSVKSEDRKIIEPTASILAGSTAEWLHKAMPDGSMEGGFIPRFIVVFEEYAARHVAWIKYSLTKNEKQAAEYAHAHFMKELKALHNGLPKDKRHEMRPDGAAQEMYEDWYCHRFERYPPTIREYANRSRDHVLRVALVASVLEGKTYLSETAMEFAIQAIDYSANRVEYVIRPVTKEARIAEMIKRLLPLSQQNLLRALAKSFTREEVLKSVRLMNQTGEVVSDGDTLVYRDLELDAPRKEGE